MNLDPRNVCELLQDLAGDAAHGWSIGSFGAIGEFSRDTDEPVSIDRGPHRLEFATARGALRIAPAAPLRIVAYDTLASDGERWGHALSLCVRFPGSAARAIRELGLDHDAIRECDRAGSLFDLGVAAGAVRMCVRTRDGGLIDALSQSVGADLLHDISLTAQIIRAQPHRVLLSPAGRIEVYQPIPTAGGTSPAGPHTHLLPKLIAKGRTHSSNVPIPDGWQAVLTVHPQAPWRVEAGAGVIYDAGADAAFAPLLARFGLPEDIEVRNAISAAVQAGSDVAAYRWPLSRRGRTTARITLRRLAAAQVPAAPAWRALHDGAALDAEREEER